MELDQDQLLIPVPGTCARLGGVSRTTVYDLVNKGELVKVNIGRARIHHREVARGLRGSAQ